MTLASDLYKIGLITKAEADKMASETIPLKKLSRESWNEFDKYMDEHQN